MHLHYNCLSSSSDDIESSNIWVPCIVSPNLTGSVKYSIYSSFYCLAKPVTDEAYLALLAASPATIPPGYIWPILIP